MQKFRSIVAQAAGGVANLLYPPACCYCESPTESSGAALCQACRELLVNISTAACSRCAAPLPAGWREQDDVDCPLCRDTQFHFAGTAALGVFHDDLRNAVLKMKQPAGVPLALALGNILAKRIEECWSADEIDAIAPIPMHWLRRVQRGINAPDVICEAVGARLKLRPLYHLLRCRRLTRRQSMLQPRVRRRNIRGAWKVAGGYDVANRRILLIDDVLTTGFSMSEAARMLRLAGAEIVRAAVIARGIGVD